jgi:hypothetical protein
MSALHGIVLVHVAAMIGLFSTLTIEGLAVRFLRRASSYEQAREWVRLWALLPIVGAPSILLSLASGIYLATVLGMWSGRWAAVAVPTLVIVAIVGGITGPRRSRLQVTVNGKSGAVPAAVGDEFHHPLFATSWIVRTALLAGMVVDMVLKPDAAIGLLTLFLVGGVVCSIPLWRRRT